MPTIEPDWVSEAPASLEPLGQAEVGHEGNEVLERRIGPAGQQDIRRLQVAVEDASLMGVMNGTGDRCGEPRRGARGWPRNRSTWAARLPPSTSFMLK